MTGPSSNQPLHLMPRRRFLRNVTLVSGAAVAGVLSPWGDASAAPSMSLTEIRRALNLQTPQALDAYEPVALTPGELETLKSATERLIPTDELGPGAIEAGVFVFIDQALAGGSAATLPLFQAGLAALDAAAGEGGYAALDTAAQDDLITAAATGELADAPEGFFGLLLANTRGGFFSDPIWGGNKNFVGWDLLGYPGIKLFWSQEEQGFDAEIEPMHISVAEFQGE
ncbi:MAG: gluconate 2-dehydrogenase subunit 3 family protein [Thermomicrobiales bacterium]